MDTLSSMHEFLKIFPQYKKKSQPKRPCPGQSGRHDDATQPDRLQLLRYAGAAGRILVATGEQQMEVHCSRNKKLAFDNRRFAFSEWENYPNYIHSAFVMKSLSGG